MRKRHYLAIATILLVGAGFAFLVPTWRAFIVGYVRGEPFHDGKPMSYWIVQAQAKKTMTMNYHDDGSRERRAAFDALVAIGPDAVLPLTMIVQQSDYWAARWEAATTLGRMGPKAKAAVPILIAELKNPTQNRDTRAQIIEALGHIDREGAFPAFVESLADQDSFIRLMAANELKQVRGSNVATTITALEKALTLETDPESSSRAGITQAINALKKGEVIVIPESNSRPHSVQNQHASCADARYGQVRDHPCGPRLH